MAKLPKAALLRAEESIAASIAQANSVVSLHDPDGAKARAELISVLEAADKRLAQKLLTITPKANGDMKFTAAQAIAYRTQIALVIEHVKLGVEPIALEAGQKAMAKSMKQGAKLVAKLEKEFKGVSTSPSVLAVMQGSHVLKGPKAALVTRVATSLDRYGYEMGTQFSKILQVGLASGATTDQMIASLVAHGGPKGLVSLAAREVSPGVVQRLRTGEFPEGLFVRHRYWAERIIRTETAYAYNGAKFEQLLAMRADGMEVQKKIVAHFDNRTAPDSVAVHGQVRDLDKTFMDGAGRVYLYPPGRPNDRETLIPWFDDWHETPSTEPPTELEKTEAIELAQTPQQGAEPKVIPSSTEELHLLEQRARGVVEERLARDQQRAAIAAAEEEEAGKHAETLAAQVLEKLKAERLQKAKDLASLLEKQKLEAEQAAEKKEIAALNKADKSIAKKIAGKEPHLGALELYELAGTHPKRFAKIVNAHREVELPEIAITGGIKVSHEVLHQLVNDTVQSYGSIVKGKPPVKATVLADFKKSPEFAGWLDELTGKKDAKSKRLLASLFYSEGDPWAVSLKYAKGLPKLFQAVPEAYKKKYAPAAPPAKKQYDIKPSAGGPEWLDVFDPSTGKKVAYFKTAGPESFIVTPPPGLDPKWGIRTFTQQEQAADYALVISAEIQKKPPTPPPVGKKWGDSKFNQDLTREPTRIGPLAIEKAAKKDIEAHRKKARARFAKTGLTLRETATNACVDQYLEQEGLLRQQEKWSGDGSGCWYSSSQGPKAMAGTLLAKNKTPEDAAVMAKQVEGEGGDPEKYFRYSRAKYAATQEALEIRRARGDLSEHVDAEGYVHLYRGIKDLQAKTLRAAREQGEHTKVELRSVSSWSHRRTAAVNFAGSSGVVVRARVHISRIFSQYEQERIAMDRFGDGESEWIVVAEELEFVLKSTDIENPGNE